MTTEASHIPVMRDEVIEALALQKGGIYIDGTFGRGGYSRAILAANPAALYAFDRDASAIEAGKTLQAKFSQLHLIHAPFSTMLDELAARSVTAVDGITLDLGVSSPQLDEAERGFSFRADGPLDMRMDISNGQTAADLVNSADETDLADIIFRFGDERFSRRIARTIVAERATTPFTRTHQLADLVRRIVPRSKDGIDPATRTFQALRIAVNDELGELQKALTAALTLLKPMGRLVIVSFHALEDRMVKDFIRLHAGRTSGGSRHLPEKKIAQASLVELTRKPILPQDAEIEANPRARSARLRAAEKLPSLAAQGV